MLTLLTFIAGLAFLTVGGDSLVRGASGLAKNFGVSSLVIGLTVVAFGTSAPELIVSLLATFDGKPDIAVGNVVGSNIFNVLFILGACALLKPLDVSKPIVWRDVPIMIAASLACWFFAMDRVITRGEGLTLFASLIVFVIYTIRESRREALNDAPNAEPPESTLKNVGFAVVGLAGLMLGARWLVEAASTTAQQLGVSDAVIGLTIVAAGTSMPEVAASIAATLRGQRDIAVGNVIGSNIFNILCIMGLTGIAAPRGVNVAESIYAFDLPVMLAVALACSPLLAGRHSIERWAGGLFLFYYVAYTAYLVLQAQNHAALQPFSDAMLSFVLPFTLVIVVVEYIRERGRSEATATTKF